MKINDFDNPENLALYIYVLKTIIKLMNSYESAENLKLANDCKLIKKQLIDFCDYFDNKYKYTLN